MWRHLWPQTPPSKGQRFAVMEIEFDFLARTGCRVTSREPSAISSNKHSTRRSQPGLFFVVGAGSRAPVAPFTSKGDVINCRG